MAVEVPQPVRKKYSLMPTMRPARRSRREQKWEGKRQVLSVRELAKLNRTGTKTSAPASSPAAINGWLDGRGNSKCVRFAPQVVP